MALHVPHIQFNVLNTISLGYSMSPHVLQALLLCLLIPSSALLYPLFELVSWLYCMVFLQMFIGDDGKSRVFCYTMKKNGKPCAMHFKDDKYYEQVVLEAHYHSRANVKMAMNKCLFYSIRYKTIWFLTIGP